MPERDPAFLVGRQTATEDRHQRESQDGPVVTAVEPIHPLGQRRGDSGQRHRPPVGLGRGFDRRRCALRACRFDLRFETDGFQGAEDRFQCSRTMRHAQPTLDEVEIERRHSGHASELAPDQRLLGRTVHPGDRERRVHGSSGLIDALCRRTDGWHGGVGRDRRVGAIAHVRPLPGHGEVESRHAVEGFKIVADQRRIGGAVRAVDAV